MDQSDEDQRLQAVNKYINKYYGQWLMKRTLKFVVSVSLLSLFLLCYSSSSSGFCLFPHSFNEFNVYFSTLLLSIFTRTLERKYMFLICNGILAFLAKSSASCSCSPNNIDDESDESLADLGGKSSSSSVNSNLSEIGSSLDQDVIAYVADEGEQQQMSTDIEEDEEVVEDEGQEEEHNINESLYTENHDQKSQTYIAEEEGSGPSMKMKQREELDTPKLATNVNNGDEYYLSTSTDELNKKFEEFIRKMKEEIRIEAQRQPIAV